MGKKKFPKDNETEEERLLKENRDLKVLNRSLMRKLKKLDRDFKESDIKEDEEPFEQLPAIKENCPDCHRTELQQVNIAGRLFKKCSTCGYRTKAIKIG